MVWMAEPENIYNVHSALFVNSMPSQKPFLLFHNDQIRKNNVKANCIKIPYIIKM